MDETALATAHGVARIFDLHALKAFDPDKRVRKMLFKTDQLWSEIACYEPGQSTAMHQHPREEEAIFVLEGVAQMSIDGEEVSVPAGAIVQFPNAVLHDVRNPGPGRCVIMFLKVNPKVWRGAAGGEPSEHGHAVGTTAARGEPSEHSHAVETTTGQKALEAPAGG